jgi:hypothetical protein
LPTIALLSFPEIINIELIDQLKKNGLQVEDVPKIMSAARLMKKREHDLFGTPKHKVLIFRCMKVISQEQEGTRNRSMSNKKDESSEDGEPEPDADNHRNNGNQHKRGNQLKRTELVENVLVIKSNTLDEGTLAFIHWLNSTHKSSTIENPITVKDFVNDKRTVLWDNTIPAEVEVETKDGVPVCKYCKADDCAHVGFTICLEQLHGRGETLESIEAEAEAEGTNISDENQTTTRILSYYLCITPIAFYVFLS